LEEQLDFLAEEEPSWQNGVSWPVIGSVIVHAGLLLWFIFMYHPVTGEKSSAPIPRYITLMRQNPDFVEAPGKKVPTAPLNAPYSDANRKAASPKPTGDQPSKRPGQGGIYAPSLPRPQAQSAQAAQQSPSEPREQQASAEPQQQPRPLPDSLTYRSSSQPTQAAAASHVDWKSAIREVGKVASLGSGGDGEDLGNAGGDKGFGETGPLSFETQWFNWGDYAESMVSKIRVNWYAGMPQLIRTGMKGVVTIRFTIKRDGRVTDVTIVNSSGVPPYDFAAKKAIEQASPLNPLPADFPKDSERVTCVFFYNEEPPAH
jgi:TonB family protein